MTRLLLVRHGETEWCSQLRHKGQKDIPLNDTGFRQAQRVGERLKTEDIQAIYSSDLSRTLETAKCIAEHQELVINQENRLREMLFGDWEGLTFDEILQHDDIDPQNWHKILLDPGPPGGESLGEFSKRVKMEIDKIISSHPNDSVLIVSHGGTLMVMICHLLNHPIDKYWQFRLDRASISEIEVLTDGAIIIRLNDTGHLTNMGNEA